MRNGITVPVTRAVDRALRMLQLTYQMVTRHRGVTAADAQRLVAGYRPDVDSPATVSRKFEHDKKGLRTIGIPIQVQLLRDPPASCYKVRPRDLFLPSLETHRDGWAALQGCAPLLQRLADQVPVLPAHTAAPVSSALLALQLPLGLALPTWPIPQGMLGHGPSLVDWLHAVLLLAAARGRSDGPWGGAPVPVDGLAQATGLPAALIRHLAERGGERSGEGAESSPLVRIVPVPAADAMRVLAPEMKAGWRPQRRQVDTLVATAQRVGMPIPAPGVRALRSFSRGSPASPVA